MAVSLEQEEPAGTQRRAGRGEAAQVAKVPVERDAALRGNQQRSQQQAAQQRAQQLGNAMPLATMPLLPNRSNAPTYFP